MICKLSGSKVDSSSPVKVYVFCGAEPECIGCNVADKPLELPKQCPKCGYALVVNRARVYCQICNEKDVLQELREQYSHLVGIYGQLVTTSDRLVKLNQDQLSDKLLEVFNQLRTILDAFSAVLAEKGGTNETMVDQPEPAC